MKYLSFDLPHARNFNGTHARILSDLYFILLPRSSFFFLFRNSPLRKRLQRGVFFLENEARESNETKKSNGRIGNEIGTLVLMESRKKK